jgi:Domain of unknown function (DUF4411)
MLRTSTSLLTSSLPFGTGCSRSTWLARFFTVQSVYDEVVGGGDDLSQWMKAQPASFRIAPGSADSAGLTTVSAWVNGAGFKPAAVSDFLAAADYFIVAQALTLGYTVVTHETPDPASKRRVKIPDACSATGVACVSPYKWLRDSGARF